jgi:hypothetical protein
VATLPDAPPESCELSLAIGARKFVAACLLVRSDPPPLGDDLHLVGLGEGGISGLWRSVDWLAGRCDGVRWSVLDRPVWLDATETE